MDQNLDPSSVPLKDSNLDETLGFWWVKSMDLEKELKWGCKLGSYLVKLMG